MIMVDREIIREIQLSGLRLLHGFDEVCRKSGASYFAFAGTLLGAIRHNGYIPWDDDLDIGILREDLDRLTALPKDAWGDDVELVMPDDPDPRHDKVFPRVYLKNTRIQSYRDVRDWIDPVSNRPWSTSLMIDLYVFDAIPDDQQEYLRIRKAVHKSKKWYKAAKLPSNLKGIPAERLAKNFGKEMYRKTAGLISKEPWKKLYQKQLAAVRSGRAGSRIGSYYSNHEDMYFERTDVFPLQTCRFEDMEIPIPKNFDRFLRIAYGDTYMQFPPEKDRFHINFIFADLGNGQVFCIDPIPGSLGEANQSSLSDQI